MWWIYSQLAKISMMSCMVYKIPHKVCALGFPFTQIIFGGYRSSQCWIEFHILLHAETGEAAGAPQHHSSHHSIPSNPRHPRPPPLRVQRCMCLRHKVNVVELLLATYCNKLGCIYIQIDFYKVVTPPCWWLS